MSASSCSPRLLGSAHACRPNRAGRHRLGRECARFADQLEDVVVQPGQSRVTTSSLSSDRAGRATMRSWRRRSSGGNALVVDGRYGVRGHPAVAIARDAKVAFDRLHREIDLEGMAAADPRMLRPR
jgi:hypothetical protein